jgi:hypothetical protein
VALGQAPIIAKIAKMGQIRIDRHGWNHYKTSKADGQNRGQATILIPNLLWSKDFDVP